MALVDRHIAAWAVMLLGLIPGFMEYKRGTGRLGSCPIRSLGGRGLGPQEWAGMDMFGN